MIKRMSAVMISLGCFFLRPSWVFCFFVMFWPHSGQVLGLLICVFRLWSEYLHFRQ